MLFSHAKTVVKDTSRFAAQVYASTISATLSSQSLGGVIFDSNDTSVFCFFSANSHKAIRILESVV